MQSLSNCLMQLYRSEQAFSFQDMWQQDAVKNLSVLKEINKIYAFLYEANLLKINRVS